MTTTAATPAPTTTRLPTLDALRGLAILLMVLDHALVMVAPGHWLRYTLTRASLPLFALVAGYLWRPGWRTRYLIVWAAGFAATVAGQLVGIAQPDVLYVILIAFVAVWAFDALDLDPVWTVAAGVGLMVIAETGWGWPYAGYDPRWVAGIMLLGRTIDVGQLGHRLAGSRVLVTAGRWPLTLYVGHLVVLGVLAMSTGRT